MHISLSVDIATHYHWDHIGDKERGILGLKYFVDREDFPVRAGSSAQPVGLPAYIHSAEAEAAISKCDIVRRERISPVENNTIVWIGDAVRLRFIHTPGHSKGGVSIVIGTKRGGHPVADKLMANDDNVVEKEVLTGDTLFPGSCGRIDLPESDKGEMYKTLQNVLRGLPGTMVVWPGHGARSALCCSNFDIMSESGRPDDTALFLLYIYIQGMLVAAQQLAGREEQGCCV
eukprot:SAG31_NODE_231_length_19768_cov_9.498170_2_plen_231_part_00